jgi:hypothetical protein
VSTDLGDLHQLAYDHYANGSLASAGAATWTVTLPDGTVTSFAATATSPGVYRDLYQTVQAGTHHWRWVGTGVNPGAQSGTFDVRPAARLDLISLAAAKRALNIAETSTAHDEELREFIEAVTNVIEGPDGLGEVVARRAIVEDRTVPRASSTVTLDGYPVISLTSVVDASGVDVYDVANLHADGPTGIVTVTAGPKLRGNLRITYVAGYTVIPANIAMAARMVLQDAWATQRGSRGGPRFAGQDESMAVEAPVISRRARQMLAGGAVAGIA